MNRQEVRVTCADDEILLCLGEGGGSEITCLANVRHRVQVEEGQWLRGWFGVISQTLSNVLGV